MCVHILISAIERYSEETGLSPSTIGRRAVNNPRLLERLKKRAEKTERDARRVFSYIKSNPAPSVLDHSPTDHLAQPSDSGGKQTVQEV